MNRKVGKPTLFEPQSVMHSSRRAVVNNLLREGRSVHSGRHGTLAYVIDFCERVRASYTLTAQPGEGYLLQLNDGSLNFVTVTHVSLRKSEVGRYYLKLTLRTLVGRRVYLSIDLESVVFLERFLKDTSLTLGHGRSCARLRGKSFYCRVLTEHYGNKPVDRVTPVRVWED